MRIKALQFIMIIEVYLVLQNAFDDDRTFAATTVIYEQLVQCGNNTNTEVIIYHTVLPD